MEIKGEDFIKKVQLKKEEQEIEQRLNEIKDAQSIYEEQQPSAQETASARLDREVEIQEEQEYSDIMLGKSSSTNAANKKKYLILGLVLVILFLLTIIIIRLLTNDSVEKNDSFAKKEDNGTTQQVLDNGNIEEQYQKIINEKLKNIQEENQKDLAANEAANEKLNLKEIEQKETVTPVKKEETKPDVFDVKKAETKPVVTSKPKPIVKKIAPKKVVKPVVSKAKVTTSTTTSKPKGTFVQIGAFSKTPNDKYLDSITKKGFKYKIYKVSINNKMFHKVLIGPYNSRGQAKLAIDKIKKQLDVSGAFILTF
jgi:DedD protein